MKKYKIVVCNLGYENKRISSLDNNVGTLKELLNKIKKLKLKEGENIEGFKVIKINLALEENNFKNDEAINIIETNDCDRCIYIYCIGE